MQGISAVISCVSPFVDGAMATVISAAAFLAAGWVEKRVRERYA